LHIRFSNVDLDTVAQEAGNPNMHLFYSGLLLKIIIIKRESNLDEKVFPPLDGAFFFHAWKPRQLNCMWCSSCVPGT